MKIKLSHDFVTYLIIVNTDCGRYIGKSPQTSLHKVNSLLFEILEFLQTRYISGNSQLLVVPRAHHKQPSNPYSTEW